MVATFLTLSGRIRREFAEIERVVNRIAEGWRRAQASNDDYYLDGVALNLHGSYAGLERIFELIADEIDGFKPHGAQWYVEILRQMASDIPRVRIAVISPATAEKLDSYRGFRHVVRNVYTFNLDVDRDRQLVEGMPDLMAQVSTDLNAFADYLEGLANIDEDAS